MAFAVPMGTRDAELQKQNNLRNLQLVKDEIRSLWALKPYDYRKLDSFEEIALRIYLCLRGMESVKMFYDSKEYQESRDEIIGYLVDLYQAWLNYLDVEYWRIITEGRKIKELPPDLYRQKQGPYIIKLKDLRTVLIRYNMTPHFRFIMNYKSILHMYSKLYNEITASMNEVEDRK